MVDVTCAIIRNEDDEILVVQRGPLSDHPLKWEFPGGKVKPGESNEDCVIREIGEELSMDIVIVSTLPDVVHDYGFRKIRLMPFICDTLDELPVLNEHSDFRWISRNELQGIDFCEADVKVAEMYMGECPEQVIATHAEPEDILSENTPSEELQSAVIRLMSMKEAEWMAVSAIENPEVLRSLVDYSYSADHKLAFKASWVLTKVNDLSPETICPYLDRIAGSLSQVDNESAVRSFLRILSFTDMNKLSLRNHGILADNCFSFLRSGFSSVAVKAYAMEILYKLVLIYPELKNELVATINILQIDGPGGILSRGRMIIKKLSSV